MGGMFHKKKKHHRSAKAANNGSAVSAENGGGDQTGIDTAGMGASLQQKAAYVNAGYNGAASTLG